MKEIVIELSDEQYNAILRNAGWVGNDLYHTVKNGTLLPKRHGRISDMDAAIKCIEDVTGEDAIRAIGLIEWACGKRVLIEADKAESEENDLDSMLEDLWNATESEGLRNG